VEKHQRGLYTGIITTKMAESKDFYTQLLGFEVAMEMPALLVLQAPDGGRLAFMPPDLPSQPECFQQRYEGGAGVFLSVAVEDAPAVQKQLEERAREQNIELHYLLKLTEEKWGDTHFAVRDPNGVPVDIVSFVAPGTAD
jgi:catechol 2,3-dioxygenase-like lactoylglutathione lyase family enzyme